MLARHPTEVLRKAVHGMLPGNKMRDIRLDRLKLVVEGQPNPFEVLFPFSFSFSLLYFALNHIFGGGLIWIDDRFFLSY